MKQDFTKKVKSMNRDISFTGTAEKFPGKGGWVYVALKASLRKKEKISVGDRVNVSFTLVM